MLLFLLCCISVGWIIGDWTNWKRINYAVALLISVVMTAFLTLFLCQAPFLQTKIAIPREYELRALNTHTKTSVSGAFFLGTGLMQGTSAPCYYFIKKDDNGGYSMEFADYRDVQIFFIKDGERPAITTFYWHVLPRFGRWIIPFSLAAFEENQMAYKSWVRIPENSVDDSFSVSTKN